MIILYSIVLGRCCLITCLSRSVDYFINMEQWKEIIWYEWKYQVSNLWRIKSLNYNRTWKEIIMKWINCGYYLRIDFYKKWLRKSISIHRLVAEHFISNPDNLPLVCHKIEKLNKNWALYNWADNLFWWTRSDNMQDMWKKWRGNSNFKLNHPDKWRFWSYNRKSKKVLQYNKNWEFIKEWGSIIDASKIILISKTSISDCCRNKIKYAWWFIWKFKTI